MRLMKQPYTTYATAAIMGQLELESGVNFLLHPSEVPHITVKDFLRFLTFSRRFSWYPGKEYQGLYWGMDYGPICGLV